MVFGFPLRAVNRLSAARNASVDKLVTSSIRIALETKQKQKLQYSLW
jgi:hypothetical protein